MTTPVTRRRRAGLGSCWLACLLLAPAPLLGHGAEVLVFSKTAGFRHGSIPAGIQAITELAAEHQLGVTFTEDAAEFVSELPNHHVAVFLNTTGDVLDDTQQSAFRSWFESGRGCVGVHAATDTEHDWPWYLEMMGARFLDHPAVQTAEVKFLDRVHPITNVEDPATGERVERWSHSDEWYNFTASPRGRAHVLAVLDESSYSGGKHGDDHPVAWCRDFDGGRSAYLAMGHTDATFSSPVFRGLLVNAIEWASGEFEADSGASIPTNYEKIVLDDNVVAPMALDVDRLGNIYLVERRGTLKRHNQQSGLTTVIGQLDTYTGGEFGALGIVLDPGFDPEIPATRHLYVMYSPNPSTATTTRVSRFTLDSGGDLDPGSEVVVLGIEADRPANHGGSGHHQGGCLRFDESGNLWISAGDNTDASSYSPRHTGDIMRDARKSAPNSADLRGGLLRIRPDIGGGPAEHPNYTIPGGNLFPPGTPATRPEIYTTGARNCFRFCIDPHTGWVYYGDVGPDGGGDSASGFGGPQGHDEFNQVRGPGWFGWPYFIADNKPYLDGSAQPWTIDNLRGDLAAYFTEPVFLANGGTPGNPALLSDPQPAWIWYPYGAPPEQFSEFAGSTSARCALAGAVYRHRPGGNFPAYHDRTVFLMEWSRNELYEVKTDAAGDLLEVTEFAPHLDFSRPIEMVFGPDGAMYLIEWGSSFGSGSSADTALVKIRYTLSNQTPVAVAAADLTSGDAPLTVQFSSQGSRDPEDGLAVSFAWDFDGDLVTDSTDPDPQHTYASEGTYRARLAVTDQEGLVAFDTVVVSVGNHAPTLRFREPLDHGFFDWGDTLAFAIEVEDPEDGDSASDAIPPEDVLFEASLGHGDHQHTEFQDRRLSGRVVAPRDDGHPFDADLAYVFDAFYTDRGAPGVEPISGSTKLVLQPKVRMAQYFDRGPRVSTAATLDPVGGGSDVVDIHHRDTIRFDQVDLGGIDEIRLRASSPGGTATVRVHQDSVGGPLVATIPIDATSSATEYRDFTAPLADVLPGVHELHFLFDSPPTGAGGLRLNWIAFRGAGATHEPQRPVVTGVEVPERDRFRIRFDQPMDFAELADVANYRLDPPAAIASVTPAPDQRSVELHITGTDPGSHYPLALSGLEDLAGDPIAADTKVLLLTPASSGPEGFALGINCGATGPQALHVDATGRVFFPDRHFSGGGAGSGSDPIAGTADDPLYQSGRSDPGEFAYEIPVPAAGDYRVTLKFAELTASADGERVFDVLAEEAVLIDDLDVHALAGPDTAVDREHVVRVEDGGLSLAFRPAGAGQPRVAAIHVEGSGASNNVPAIPFGLNAGGPAYQSVIDATPYLADAFFSPTGSVYSTPGASYVGSGGDNALYQVERYHDGEIGWQVPLRDGRYRVILQFAESWSGASSPGVRRFHVALEGEVQSPDPVDLAELAGYRTVYEMDRTLDIADGHLSVLLTPDPGFNNPKLNAIKIIGDPSGGLRMTEGFFTWLGTIPELAMNPDADPDRDRMGALLEYALAGSPLEADPAVLPRIQRDGGGPARLSFDRPLAAADLAYQLQASHGLGAWTDIAPTLDLHDLGNGLGRATYADLEAAAAAAGLEPGERCFFRLQVSLQPHP